ncbi:MAG TPA: Uma2 family endonuclease [Blastocatellia bacterium]|nr:Uma2 family endonuclease [Blastocatellia bacterium]HMV86779.1 Uma2 family endonuclease [Blastocatellia bacterium]HMX25435.1 Uma2 family endonuclease [Blastocatellia bacterium]HMY72157.1 Uma2 family endonuclease [Blastocatellia bacterium]HMZ19483.1 Uma2 family endonuclease [Blastocatellia bacterium]
MALRKLKPYLSVADYLAGEKESQVRYEYVDGQVYAMAGASDRHNRIALNLSSRLNERTSSGPCETFMSDMKVKVDPVLYYYPDVVVTCDAPGGDPYLRTQPRLIVEVLSPTTERIDRNEKSSAYRRTPSLLEYALVSQDEMRIELHRRQADGQWTLEIFTQAKESLTLHSVELTLTVADVYRNVRLPEE